MEDKAFGLAGDNMVIEEFLDGEEVSIFAICDGNDYLLSHRHGGDAAYDPPQIMLRTEHQCKIEYPLYLIHAMKVFFCCKYL